MIAFAWFCFGCALLPATLYLWNAVLFREPPLVEDPEAPLPSVSVLIPARNEELGIAACVESVLASRGVELEVIVLDDHSTDRTAAIVREIAARDSRLRLEFAPALPEGWCGKQHACFALAKLASSDRFVFLDADVRLQPEAVARMLAFLEVSQSELVSGFPRQETGTLLEKLLIPLIVWLLLGFLPLSSMRRRRWAAMGAGCGQWFTTTRTAYDKVGGHAAIKATLHDGLMLPRAYRRLGFKTDLCDASNLATCRMYRSASQVWFGLAKNAREGMAATGQIWFWTTVLLCGQVLPFLFLALAVIEASPTWPIFGAACLISLGMRSLLAIRFERSWLGAALHPIAILLVIAIQWYAVWRAILGKPVGWKGRSLPTIPITEDAKSPALS